MLISKHRNQIRRVQTRVKLFSSLITFHIRLNMISVLLLITKKKCFRCAFVGIARCGERKYLNTNVSYIWLASHFVRLSSEFRQSVSFSFSSRQLCFESCANKFDNYFWTSIIMAANKASSYTLEINFNENSDSIFYPGQTVKGESGLPAQKRPAR